MATDPVCFMIIDEDTAQFRSTYRDTEYYFCCNYCKKQFDANPKRYSRLANDMTVDLDPAAEGYGGIPARNVRPEKQVFCRARQTDVPGLFTGYLT